MKLARFVFPLGMSLIISFCLNAEAGTVTTIDVPGATQTFAQAINDFGAITGFYFDATGGQHGFLRTARGTIITFDPPGSVLTNAVSINDFGVITGLYADVSNTIHGFLRSPQGMFTSFDAPGCCDTEASSINLIGAAVGIFFNLASGAAYSGFVRAGDGTITTFDAPGNFTGGQGQGTYPKSINVLGAITGLYIDAGNPPCGSCSVEHGFLRAPDGTMTAFDAPGANGTEAHGINDFGTITGFYFNYSDGLHGFIRTADGGLTSFDAPGSAFTPGCGTVAVSINDFGSITGSYSNTITNCTTNEHGYVRSASGTFTTFDPPGSTSTTPQSINLFGAVTGVYVSSSGTHGFLFTP